MISGDNYSDSGTAGGDLVTRADGSVWAWDGNQWTMISAAPETAPTAQDPGATDTSTPQPAPSNDTPAAPQVYSAPTAPTVSAPSASSGSLTAPFTEQFTPPPQINLGGPTGISYIPPTPTFTAPDYTPPPAFTFQDFQAPDYQQAMADPGYQFRLGEGRRNLEAGAAARGVLNSGGTLKDLLNYGQQAASQEYQNVFNRAYQTYNTNRANAVDQYNTNYGTQFVDPYKYAFEAKQAEFAPQMQGYLTTAAAGQHQNDLDYLNAWNKYLQDYNVFRNQQNDTFDKLYRYNTL